MRSPFPADNRTENLPGSVVLCPHPSGQYSYLPGIEPYSCGVVAAPGYRISRMELPAPMPWRRGFEGFIDLVLRDRGLSRGALCGVELRSPAPFPMNGFIDFNRGYLDLLRAWGLLLGSVNPIARTNVVPFVAPPTEVVLHAFSYVHAVPSSAPEMGRSTFVVAGAGELREARLDASGIVRRGELSSDALREKCDFVISTMDARLRGLGVDWNSVTRTTVYTIHSLDAPIRDRLLAGMGPAARRGILWDVARPPVIDIEFEMDLHGLGVGD